MSSEIESRLAKLSPEKRALLERKMKAAAAKKSRADKFKIPPRRGSGPWPASEDQTALWFFHQMDPKTYAYNNGTGVRIKGPVDLEVLGLAVNELLRRHEALRTTLYAVGDDLFQKVTPHLEIDLPLTDISDRDPDQAWDEAMALIPDFLREPFDLVEGPLVYFPMIKLADHDFIMCFIMHHAVTDWWSFKLVVQETMTIYQAYLNGQSSPLPELPIQFIDYTLWRNNWLKSERFTQQADYWRNQLEGAPLVLDLPTDRPRPAQQDFRGKRLYRSLGKETLAAIRDVNTAHRASSLMTCISAVFSFLHRYAGVDDVLIGTPTTERDSNEMENMVGYLLNVLILRAKFTRGMTFDDLVDQMKKTVLDGLANKDFPFRNLARMLNPERDLSRMPIYQIDFNHVAQAGPSFEQHSRQAVSMRLPGHEVIPLEVNRGISDVDLQVNFTEGLSSLRMVFEWATALFDDETTEHMADLMTRLIEELTARPDQPIDEADWLSGEERSNLLERWNKAPRTYDRETDIAALFDRGLADHGNLTAVAMGDETIDYQTLAARANQLAHALIERGIEDNAPVGICLPQGIDWVVSMLAILKAGSHYVPLDASYPHERISFMIADTGMTTLITDSTMIDSLPAMELNFLEAIVLDEEREALAEMDTHAPAVTIHPDSLAYTIYTSGTTGKPKGVQVPHRAVLRLIADETYCHVKAGDGVAQASNISFDAHVFEVWTALPRCARLVIVDRESYLETEKLYDLLREQEVDHMFVTTALFNQHVREISDTFATLQTLCFGGERVDVDAVRKVIRGGAPARLRHVYGPTETVTFATWFDAGDPGRDYTVPIGGPIANTELYVIDPYGNPAAAGVHGELCIGGDCLSRGYLNDPGLTATRFVPNPFSTEPGARIYRTGDVVKWRLSGAIEFIGRSDKQVKLRGFRIELGEIETALTDHELIAEATAILRNDDGKKRIAAYVVPAEGTSDLDTAVLRDHLASRLPEYMIPAAFVVLEALPLTPNGKVDVRALPEPELKTDRQTHVAPRNANEEKLAAIWTAVIGAERVGIHDNFFELGGDSILGIQMIAAANRAGLSLGTRDLFAHQTVAELAAAAGTGRDIVAEQGPVVGEIPLTPIQHWFFETVQTPDHFNMGFNLKPKKPLRADLVEASLNHLIAHHDALRIRFTREGDEVRQVGQAVEGNHLGFEVVDLSDGETPDDAFSEHMRDFNTRLDLTNGPLVWAVLADLGPAMGQRLAILVHHLVFDWISSRILIEDLQSIYQRLEADMVPALPPKTTSWQHWSRRLAEHADAEITRAESDWWAEQARLPGARLPVDRPEAPNTEKSAIGILVSLNEGETRALLQEVPEVYNTRINDLLLTALLRTVAEVTGTWSLRIALEGHGREELFDDVDFSRTIGWFTTLFPVVMHIDEDTAEMGAAIKAVKEQLRAIPRNGIGYGLSRYAAASPRDDIEPEHPQISFNYLGQIDNTGGEEGLLEVSGEKVGPEHAPDDTRSHEIEIVGVVFDGKLHLMWRAGGARFEEQRVRDWAEHHLNALRAVIDHCRSPEAGGRTPSDFPTVPLTQSRVDALMARFPDLETVYPTLPLVSGMLFHASMDRTSFAYRQQFDYPVSAGMDRGIMRKAIETVLARHQILRACYPETPEGFLTVIRDAPIYEWEEIEPESREALEAHKQAILTRPHTLDEKPFQVFTLATVDGADRLIWSFHHVSVDGWSAAHVFNEIGQLYEAMRQHLEVELPEPIPYARYMRWFVDQDPAEAERYWRDYLAGFEEPTLIAPSHETERESIRHKLTKLELSQETTERLEETARSLSVTTNILLNAAWALVLSHYLDRDDVAFGVTVSGRPGELDGIESLVGCLINTLPLRVRMRREQTVAEWVTELREQTMQGRAYEYATLPEIQRLSEVPAGQSLFDTLVVFENYPKKNDAVENISGTGKEKTHFFEQTNYPITCIAGPGRRMAILLRIDEGLFPEGFADQLSTHLVTALTLIANRPDAQTGTLELVAREEVAQQRAHAGTSTDYPRDQTITALFSEIADRHGDQTALSFAGRGWSYGDLARTANRIGRYLEGNGLEPGDRVGISVSETNPIMIASFLGVMAAGGVYVPLDASLPEQRRRFIIDDAGIDHLILDGEGTDHGIAHVLRFSETDADALEGIDDGPLARGAHPLQAAYIMYTSGSTGQPKGVVIPHRAVIRLVRDTDFIDIDRRDVFLQGSVPSFDASTLEIWGSLLNGARLVLADSRAHGDFPRLIAAEGVTKLWLTAQLFNLMVDTNLADIGTIQTLLIGGEALSGDHVRRFREAHPEVRLINGYGPTEGTTFTTTCDLTDRADWATPIGRPIANTRTHVLGIGMRAVPIDRPGELFIGGDGLAWGYLNNPALTATRFVPDPFADETRAGARLYRSGDTVRMDPRGTIHFIGRRDQQVKLRGFRIELGEIESALADSPAVARAVVLLKRDLPSGDALVAYVVPEGEGGLPDSSDLIKDLRTHLATRLPEQMIPAFIQIIEHLPLKPSGKLDVAALPDPEHTGATHVAPSTPVEEAIVMVWQELLGREKIGVHDNFFELGAHSLLVTRSVSMLRDRMGIEIPLKSVFEAPDAARLARFIEVVQWSQKPEEATDDDGSETGEI